MAELCSHAGSQQSQRLGSDGAPVLLQHLGSFAAVVGSPHVHNGVHMAALAVTGTCEMCAVLLYLSQD